MIQYTSMYERKKLMEVGTRAAFQITEQIRRRLKRELSAAGSILDAKLEEVTEDAVAAALDLKQEEKFETRK